MIKVETCRGCGRHLLVGKIANLQVKCDPTPLTDVGEIVRLLTSPNPPALWMVEKDQQGRPTRLRGARPGEPGPVAEHRCVKAADAVVTPSTPKGGETVPPKAPRPPAAPSRPPSGHSMGSSGVPGADRPTSRPVVLCDRCSKPCTDGTYASIELGELTVWAEHIEGECR